MDSNSNSNPHNIFKQGIQNFQVSKYKEVEKYYLSETIKLSLITGPLYCISANLQFLNLNSTKNLQVNYTGSIGLSKLKSISLPYKPTFYMNYKDCIFNLYRQGILGFYKGNMYRLLFFYLTNKLKSILDSSFSKINFMHRNLKEFFLYSFADIALNPLLVIESRYSIQNRRKGFRIYNNVFEVISKSWNELYRGAIFSIPRNLFLLIGLNFYFIYPSNYTQVVSVFLAHLLSYPILTIQRNRIFHSVNNEYLSNLENNSCFNYTKYIISNTGILHLYRGFFSFLIATCVWHLYVPYAAKAKFYKNIFLDESKNDSFKINFTEDDEYEAD